ncbi:splicing regulatory glutamine/lysine-rich protein 1 isoform X3 [Centruroides vittatus]|uniref:splicing regulatory glutamine/lysine-rich protein 1 isoform X3 n=1 Tax=Centruroides vittatus TaxID=120091 RepID=UPI00351000F2
MENSYIHQSAELLELTLNTNVIQVTNVAPAATLDQMQTLFSFLGEVDEIKMYPAEDCPLQPSSRICYVRYADKTSVGVAQHLTNTVFIDRALIVVPVADGIIPDETKAMAIASPSPNVSGMVNSGQSQLMNQVVSGVGGSQVITTIDPHLTALGLPQYPPLPANMDPTKIEEIRRTVYVGNLDSTVTAEGLLKFFNQIGEVKYVRMAGDETQPTRFAFVEFTEQTSVANALQYNGVIFGGRPLKINHSNNAIVKPQAKSSEAAQREIEEAMKRVREAQSLITAAIEPVLISELAEKEKKKDKSRSRSRSRSRIRSLSRSRRRSRSRSHHRSRSSRRSRSRSHHRSPLHRSHSHNRRHSRSPGHHSSSRSKVHKSRSRSRDRHSKRSRSPHTRHHRSRSKSKDRASKKHTRSRSRSKSPSKKKSSKSSKSDSKKEKDKEKSPKEDKKKEKEVKETVKKEEPQNEEIKQNNLTTELEVAKIIAGILEEETKKQNESKSVKTEKSEVNEAEPAKKEEEEKGKKRQRSRHKKKREEGQSEEKDKENKKKKKEETSHKESKVVRDYDEEEKGFDSTPEEVVRRPPEPPEFPQNEKRQDSLSPVKVETKNSDSEGTDHKPGDMDLDSD